MQFSNCTTNDRSTATSSSFQNQTLMSTIVKPGQTSKHSYSFNRANVLPYNIPTNLKTNGKNEQSSSELLRNEKTDLPSKTATKTYNMENNNQISTVHQSHNAQNANKNRNFQYKNVNEKIRIFTGTAEKIIKWNKISKDYFCLYELIASMVSIQKGTVPLQQVMLLRDKKGPIIRVVHYVHDRINIENFCIGQMLRCVGRMIGPNVMHGLSIREANEAEIETLQRISHICDDAVTKSTTNH